MKFLELFSGNADISKRLKAKGFECISVDYDPKYKADLCEDVYLLDDDFLKQFSAIWLSPDCTTYSLASHGKHRRKGGVPASVEALRCDFNNYLFIQRLEATGIPFIIENPRAHFRNRPFVKDLQRVTVYYSTYGAEYQKPTDLFSKYDLSGLFNEKATAGKMHLDYAKRQDDFLGRCKIPDLLIEDICNALIYISGLTNEEKK